MKANEIDDVMTRFHRMCAETSAAHMGIPPGIETYPKELLPVDRFMKLGIDMMVRGSYTRKEIIAHMCGACAAMLSSQDQTDADQLMEKMRQQCNQLRDELMEKMRQKLLLAVVNE